MSHRNARLTVHGRLLLVDRVCRQGWPVAHAAKAMGISRQCAHRWVARYRALGGSGLVDRSSRPHHSPTRTPALVEQQVLQLRQTARRGPDWLGPELGLPPRTVTRILRRHQMPRLVEGDPLTGQVIRATKTTTTRYERDRPGELVHMDVKKIGRIPDGGGWRAHGRSEHVRGRGIGYDYVHSLVDDHSRLAYSEVLSDEKGPTCAAFLERRSCSAPPTTSPSTASPASNGSSPTTTSATAAAAPSPTSSPSSVPSTSSSSPTAPGRTAKSRD